MSTILIVDPNGRRRVAFEAEAQLDDHKVYSTGSAAEALYQAEIYVPEVVVVAADLPDKTSVEFVRLLRSSDRAQLRSMPIATPVSAAADAARPNAVLAKGPAPSTLLAAALDAIRTATPGTLNQELKTMPVTEEPAGV